MQGRAIRLICIKGGPITSLEQEEMGIISNQLERELLELSLRTRITIQHLTYSAFLSDFPSAS